ncbi:hypothetical protein HYPSUDRAFT_234789 [Hypholoma sublateritium FD-334 SS-4]|uniref:C2H2-type domain-containing protein n=1 Tax=Hypholoma sublateritium (strain FD-334 SS-4) TaxID=945553 RepID=A0A0D2LNX1_HYPSF|nr:hypothetical protein HYPSUDRAFT_234789 [Hypholoma sublateritium FD-334 SS-4]
MYNSAAGPSSNLNEYPHHTNISSSGPIASSNMDHSSSGNTHSTAERPPALQLPPPQQVNSRFVDNFGVPYIALTDEEVLGLRRQFDNWRRQAPLGTIDKLHEMLYLHKDKAPEPVTWIYVPLVPGGDRYARTSEIDKFFNILLENARQTRVSPSQPAAQPPVSNHHVPGAKAIVKPTAPIPSRRKQSQKNRPAPTPNTTNSASSSTTKAAAQLPSKSVVTSSGSTRNLPLPRLVDKKHLSQNVLFALGKRSRASTDASSSGQPAKRRTQNLAANKEKAAVTSGSSEPAVAVESANSSEVSSPSIATASNKSSVPPLAQVPPMQPNNGSHSISSSSVNVTSKLSHQQSTTPITITLPPPSTVSVNGIPQQKPVTIKIPSTAKPVSVAGPSLSKVSDPKPSPGISNVAPTPAREGSGQQKTPSEVNPSSAVFQNPTGSANGKAKAPKAISGPVNPYMHLLSVPEPFGLQASRQQQGQRSAGYVSAASGSSISQVGSFSYNDISTSQSSWLQPPTNKRQPNKQNEPLFLPSSSPERGPSQVANQSEGGESSRLKNGKKENRAYVLVPEPPEYLVRYRQRTAYGAGPQSDTEVTRQMMQSLRTGTSSVPTSVVGEEDAADELQHPLSIEEDNTEQQAIDLACSRLQPLTCRWNGCNVDLNSINALIQHLEQHKPSSSSNDQFLTCRWSQCGRRFRYNEKHLEKHALLSLKCAFKDCDEFYRSGSRLLKHYTEKHTESELKPSAEFSRPNLDTPPPVPGTIPAYLFVTQLAKPATITPERHEVLCRWVVQNIVNSDQEKPTRMRSRKTAKNAKPRAVAPGHDYEFITARSTRYSSYLSQAVDLPLADLDSANISRMVDAGLTLWCADEENDHEQDDVRNSPPPTSPSEPDVKEEMNDAVSLGDDHHQEEQSGDEDAVEVMLTGQ